MGLAAALRAVWRAGRRLHLPAPTKQTARFAVEKRKKGKGVTVVRGLPANESDLPALLSRSRLPAGPAARAKDDLPFQHAARMRSALQLCHSPGAQL